MASNDFYNSRPPHVYQDSPRQTPSKSLPQPPSLITPNSTHTSRSPSPFRSRPYDPPYGSADQISLEHVDSYSAAGSRLQDNDQYEENIPLKSHAQKVASQDDWMHQDTQYARSPESQRGIHLAPRPTKMKRRGWFAGKVPWVVYVVSVVQIGVFIGEIVKNAVLTGSPIMIHPQFNPMIGPSTYVLINTGARFVPCMRNMTVDGVSAGSINWHCPNTTTDDATAATNQCDLSALCGFSGINDNNPDQWFRFIVPMFLHAGIIHIGFNLLLQLTLGREMEIAIGSIRFALVYFSSGIFGFVLGGNYAAPAIASTGASGCLFGIIALDLLDLLYCWNERQNPGRELTWILADIIISLVLGLLPGLDNFSHIGGFLMGLVLGVCILHSPNILRQRIGLAPTPYEPMGTDRPTAADNDVGAFIKQPIGFFKGRKPWWWVWWLIRVAALVGISVSFVVLLNNFYKYRTTCSWCKYLSCLPISNWCEIGQLSNTTSTNNTRRDLMMTPMPNLFARDWM